MASSEERMKILKMIEEGKLSAEEGTKLLAALSEKRMPTPPRAPGMPGGCGSTPGSRPAQAPLC